MYEEVCTGCGKVKDIVYYDSGIRRFCRTCSDHLDKEFIKTLKNLNSKNNYKPPSGVYVV